MDHSPLVQEFTNGIETSLLDLDGLLCHPHLESMPKIGFLSSLCAANKYINTLWQPADIDQLCCIDEIPVNAFLVKTKS